MGGAAGSSFLPAASAPPPQLHTLIVERPRRQPLQLLENQRPQVLGARERPRCPFPTPKAGRARPTFILSPPAPANRPARADSPPPPPAPPPSVAPARALLLLLPVPATRTRASPARALSLSSGPRDPLPFRLAALPRAAIFSIHPETAGLPPPPANGGSPASQSPSLPALSGGGPAPASSPSLPPNSPSGRCHHVEASAATTDVPAPAAAPHATGRGPPASRGHQPSQRWPPGSPGRLLGSPRTSCCRFPLPGACVCCRERAPPGSRGHLGAAAAVTAAATPGEARGSGHRQRQVRRVGFLGAGTQAAGQQRLGSGPPVWT